MKRLMVNCYWLLVLGSGVQGFKGSRFTVHGSWFMVYGLWFMEGIHFLNYPPSLKSFLLHFITARQDGETGLRARSFFTARLHLRTAGHGWEERKV